MVIFVDTSGLYALLDANDQNNHRAIKFWRGLPDRMETLITTNYVLLETFTLVQRRLGMDAVNDLHGKIMPAIVSVWVDAGLHQAGLSYLLGANRRQLSLVDCVSFLLMQQRSISTAFAFDHHFSEQGFTLVPEQGA